MNRRKATKPPPRAHAAIEPLEPRAMLAGVGPESWSAPRLAPAPLGTGALFSSGIILTCSSPTPGSSGSASPPRPAAGSGGTTSGDELWLLYSAGSDAVGSTSGSTGGVSKDGPALSSQYTGGSGVGKGNGTVGPLTNAELWRLYWSGAGAGSSSSSSDEGSLADDPTISARYTGGSGVGRITPLVYTPQSDGPPVFHSGVWTGDEGGVQFVQTADTGSGQDGGDPPAGRPAWNNDDVEAYYYGPRWLFEFEAGVGRYDPPKEIPKPRDELAGVVPTDPDGKYQAGRKQDLDTLPAQVAEEGKELAWFMAGWFGDRALGAAAKSGVKLINAAGASLPLWFVTRCGKFATTGDDTVDVARVVGNVSKVPTAHFTKEMIANSEVIARGSKINKINELVSTFGGTNKGWVKKKGWDVAGNEWHWYEHHGIGRKGVKPAGEFDPF